MREELGLEIEVGHWLGRGESAVEGLEIILDDDYSTLIRGEALLRERSQIR